jgi:hypothetical protein
LKLLPHLPEEVTMLVIGQVPCVHRERDLAALNLPAEGDGDGEVLDGDCGRVQDGQDIRQQIGGDCWWGKATRARELPHVALESAGRRIDHATARFVMPTTRVRWGDRANDARLHRVQEPGQPLRALWFARLSYQR